MNNDSRKTEHKLEDWINCHNSKAVWEPHKDQQLAGLNECFWTLESTINKKKNRETHPNFESKSLTFLFSIWERNKFPKFQLNHELAKWFPFLFLI